MQLELVHLPSDLRGIYDVDRDGVKKEVATRALFAHPDLADAITRMRKDGIPIVYTDIYRSAETSLKRRREFQASGGPQLAKRPGESPHNFGLAIDIDVMTILKEHGWHKSALDGLLRGYGLYCHRIDTILAEECWHYNALGKDASKHLAQASGRSTSRAVEAKVQSLYGGALRLGRDAIVAGLQRLGYLKGLDPVTGAQLTTDAITLAVRAFQAAWDLVVDGVPGPKTQRLLAFLTATIKEVIL